MQTWILIIGGLVVLGVGLDLLRRMRNASRDSYEMDFNMQQGLEQDDPIAPRRNPDFPNGGARKVDRKGEATDRSVPAVPPSPPSARVEPRIKTQAPLEDTQKIDPQKVRRAPTVPAAPKPAAAPPPVRSAAEAETESPIPMLMDTAEKPEASFSDDDDPFMSGRSPILSKPRVVPRKAPEEPVAEEVIVIHVMARPPQRLAGAQLLETVLSCGLRFGEMNIFHYHLSETDDTALFSMVNMVKPGTFDLSNMQSFETPGISLFMRLPLKGGDKVSAMETFDKMLACAKKLAQNLDAELRDQQRSVMTGQTIEHCRQRISEFARRTLSRSGKYTQS